jgi:MarR family transcriptional regulator for hemolysin
VDGYSEFMEPTESSTIQTDMERCETKPLPPLGFALHRANRLFTRMLDTELRPLGVTSAQLGPLIVLAQSGTPMLQRDLVRQSAIAQPAMVAALALLARNGFVTQRQHEQDGRAIVVELTKNGRAVVDAATPILAQCNGHASAGLTADQERELIRLTMIVSGNIEAALTRPKK